MLARRNLEPNGDCPLCQRPAYVQRSQEIDGDGVVCDWCGYYRLEEGALRGHEQERHLLSGITRRASRPPSVDARITITRRNIDDLLALARSSTDLLEQLDAALDYAMKRLDEVATQKEVEDARRERFEELRGDKSGDCRLHRNG